MSEYVRIQDKNGNSQYRNKTENKVVAKDSLSSALLEELDIAEPGTVIDSDTITQGDGDGVVNKDGESTPDDTQPKTDAPEDDKTDSSEEPSTDDEPVDTNPYRREVPQSDPGMGFPRKNGKTGDIFDVEVPHTHLRLVAGLAVPVSEKNYNEKTDAEIYDQLKKLKLV